jgi:4-hydroxy-4-methyl-2-oxoglutarate aldolase
VVVVPRDAVPAVLDAARERERREQVLRERLAAGETTVDLLGLRALLSGFH